MISTIILSASEQKVLEKYIDELENFKFLAFSDDPDKIYDALNELNKGVIFVDLDFVEHDYHMISIISERYKDIRVVVFSPYLNVESTVKSLRSGARGCLSVPFLKSEFLSVMKKIENDFSLQKKEKSKCRVITVFSNKGGIGKTSIASNLALELAKVSKEPVALVDLNFQLGDVTTFWDLKPSFDLSYMVNNLDKLNDDFLLSTLEKYKNTSLHILADPPYFKGAENISVNQIKKLFQALKSAFSYVVVDTSAGFDDKTMFAVENSDLTLLVTVANLPALRNAQRCVGLFADELSKKDSIQIVVNRYMENDEIGIEDIEELLGKKIFARIPNNYFTMMSSINKGVPVCEINKDSNVAKAYKELALCVVDLVFKMYE